MDERDDFVTVSISGPLAAVTKLMERCILGDSEEDDFDDLDDMEKGIKALAQIRHDEISKEILEVLRENEWIWSGTPGELSQKIIERHGDDADENTKLIYSSRRVGKAINKYLRQFSIIFNMEVPGFESGRFVYYFGGLTDLGKSVVGLVAGGEREGVA